MVHGICSHSPISQYLPTRFHTSAAGRLTVISRGIEVYVGFATTVLTGVPAAGTCALAICARQTIASAQPAIILVLRFPIMPPKGTILSQADWGINRKNGFDGFRLTG